MDPSTIRLKIIERLEDGDELPTFPDVALRLNQLIERGDPSIEQIAEIIEYDPVLTTRMLRLANSAAYGGNDIDDVRTAVVRIGMQSVRDVVMSLSLINNMPHSTLINYQKFWMHSISVAYASTLIERYSTKNVRPHKQCYIAGLLHDLGILMLDHLLGEQYNEVIALSQNTEQELHLLEREKIGVDHCEVGSFILKQWGLAEPIVQACLYHHEPLLDTSDDAMVTKTVHMANFVCNNQGIHNGTGSFPQGFSESAWFDSGLDIDDIPEIINRAHDLSLKADIILHVAEFSDGAGI